MEVKKESNVHKNRSVVIWGILFLFFFCIQAFAEEILVDKIVEECRNKTETVQLTGISSSQTVIYENEKLIMRFKTDDFITYLNKEKFPSEDMLDLLRYLKDESKSEIIKINDFIFTKVSRDHGNLMDDIKAHRGIAEISDIEQRGRWALLEHVMAHFLEKGNATIYDKKARVSVPSIAVEYWCDFSGSGRKFKFNDGTIFINIIDSIV
jgi:hypothetical protein